MPAPPRHPTPPFNNLHPHDRKNTAVMGISISHMRNQSSGNHPGEQISSLHCVSINNTTIYSNGPVRVRPNPRPKRVVQIRSVQFRSVPLRQNKRNNKPNHQQFIIHESINTHSTKTRRTPRSEATQSRRHQWKIAPRHRADGPPVLRRTKSDGRCDPPESGKGNGEKRHRRICPHLQEQDER